MTKSPILISTILVVISLFCQPLKAKKTAKPNILFVLLDDLGYSDLGCYGGEIKTPNIDKIAEEGLKFEAIYNSSRCCPSRASLMTGLYPPQAGIADFVTQNPKKNESQAYLGRLRTDCVTLGEVLGSAGYSTYYVGKWHLHSATNPVMRGFDEFYGYTMAHSQDQWDPSIYERLPQDRSKEIDLPLGEFYATDVFNDYALEFMKQGAVQEKPWFLFLGHSSPHFPVQAPKETVDKYFDLYMKGWDVLRDERYLRMRNIGLVDGDRWTLTERSIVPVDKETIANGYSGHRNPAWEILNLDQKKDLARRMALFAAMVDHVDQGMGKIVDYLKETEQYDNTLIMISSDNGACYEWGPLGFDGQSRKGITNIHRGAALDSMGIYGTHSSYGSAWANLSNTPLRLYKHFTHEGGTASPFIVNWPEGIKTQKQWERTPVHLMDVMPTLCEIAGAKYPKVYKGNTIQPEEGMSLVPLFNNQSIKERSIYFSHQGARAVRQGDWKVVWAKRMPYDIEWELYNIAEDRCEIHNLAKQYPEKVKELSALWWQYQDKVELGILRGSKSDW